MEQTVFFLSDRTGITVETLGRALLTQFEGVRFRHISLPFVDSLEKAGAAAARINRAAADTGRRPLVFSTLIDPAVRARVAASEGAFFDFFDTFVAPLETELGVSASHAVGRSHGLIDAARYGVRMDAVNFALAADDGAVTRDYDRADVVLIGVSRSGKTPTCLYLAMQYGVRAANFPLTEEVLAASRLPAALAPVRDRVYGLSIQPERLHRLRTERRPDSAYASLSQCRAEVRAVEALYRQEGIRFLDTTAMSIEEIATTVVHELHLERRA